MRLYDFIHQNLEIILQAWEDFARSVDTEAPTMNAVGLRNHAESILLTVAADMKTSQTSQQQIDKAHGHGPRSKGASAAHTHAITRLVAGFTMDQMVSEYRALRSSVLRLWMAQEFKGNEHHIQDMIRFNEAIDQALVESIASYGHAVELTRKTVLGVLGHDLRSPLAAIVMAGDLLDKTDYLKERERKLTNQISVSVHRATTMVNDLLDLARCNLAAGIPIQVEVTELNAICLAAIAELHASFPSASIALYGQKKVIGQFDPMRMGQVFSNLIGNAALHGDTGQPISVRIESNGNEAQISVHNRGEVIPPEAIPHIFKPAGRYSTHAANEKGSSSGLGLGLFIASEIVTGHGGSIEVESTAERGTTFWVRIPIR